MGIAYVFAYMGLVSMTHATVTICLFAILIHVGLLVMEFNWYLGVLVSLVFEGIFQWENWVFILMFAEWPMNLACSLLALSHVIFWCTSIFSLFKFNQSTYFFVGERREDPCETDHASLGGVQGIKEIP